MARSDTGGRLRARVTARVAVLRARSPVVDHLARSVCRYHRERIEYFSLRVVSRGLFLTMSMAMVWLAVMDATTSLLPGVNEITIPTMTLPDQQDLGAVVHSASTGSRAALRDVIGVLTLVVSAAMTGHALRQGTDEVLRQPHRLRTGRWQVRNLLVGFAVAVAGLLSWLLVFGTAIRSLAIRSLLGTWVPDAGIVAGKVVLIVLAGTVLTVASYVPLRRVLPDRRRRRVLGPAAAFSGFVVAANFVLLYSYVAALLDTGSSGGVVLVFTLLAWVNAVARGLFLVECWLAEDGSAPA